MNTVSFCPFDNPLNGKLRNLTVKEQGCFFSICLGQILSCGHWKKNKTTAIFLQTKHDDSKTLDCETH